MVHVRMSDGAGVTYRRPEELFCGALAVSNAHHTEAVLVAGLETADVERVRFGQQRAAC